MLVLLAAAAASPPAVVEAVPSGKWTVDFADERCTALRSFRAGGTELVFGFEPSPAGGGARLLLRLPADAERRRALRFGFRPGRLVVNGTELATMLLLMPAAGADGILLSGSYARGAADAPAPAELSRATFESEEGHFAIPLDGMARAAPVLAQCNRSLLESHGMAAAEQDRLATWPVAKRNLASYVRDNDYPHEAIRRHEQGRVEVRLRVRADGRVATCAVRASSGSAALDRQTCEVLSERARFEPARDRAGKAMEALVFSQLVWAIPD